MKDFAMSNTRIAPKDPAMRNLLGSLDGQRDSLHWLEEHRPGLACLLRALDGGPRAREKLKRLEPAHWDEVFEAIASEELQPHLLAEHQELHLLFAAVRGDDHSLASLHKHKRSFAELADMIREANERSLAAVAAKQTDGVLEGSAAADVGCLVGEMHFSRGEYYEAVEAFTRAIDNTPTADAYDGRARALRALADLDERCARELRNGS
jgi:tetratricopeptide (TPR) repeat protein